MSDLTAMFPTAAAFVAEHRDALVLGGLALTVLLLVLATRRVVKAGRAAKWLSVVSLVVGMGWSAEAMWEIATQRLHIAVPLALLGFFVFESQLAVAMLRAERHQKLYNHPGKYGSSAWLIATIMGCLAAMAGDSVVEGALRLAIPLLVTRQWWDGLTDGLDTGTAKSGDAITWTWTWRRVLIALRLAKAGKKDLVDVDVQAIARVSHRLHSTTWRWRRAWYEMRLRRLSMNASDEMLDAARVIVERVWRSADLTRPIAAADLAVVAAARAEAEAARVEAEAARAAEAEAVAWATAVTAQAEAEAMRRAEVEAEARAARAREEAEANRRAEAEATRRADVEARTAAEAEAAAAQRRAEAEATRRAEAEATATTNRQWAEVESARRAEAEALGRAAMDQTRAEARREVERELQRRVEAQARAEAAERVLADERRTREQAEAAAADLRVRLAEVEARRPRRASTAPAAPVEPLLFDGVPVPVVPGAGAATVLAVLQARKDNPGASQKELSALTGVSTRTVRSVLTDAPELAAVG